MAKYKVLTNFNTTKGKKSFKKDDEVELTVKDADRLNAQAKGKYPKLAPFLERLDSPVEDKPKAKSKK